MTEKIMIDAGHGGAWWKIRQYQNSKGGPVKKVLSFYVDFC